MFSCVSWQQIRALDSICSISDLFPSVAFPSRNIDPLRGGSGQTGQQLPARLSSPVSSEDVPKVSGFVQKGRAAPETNAAQGCDVLL